MPDQTLPAAEAADAKPPASSSAGGRPPVVASPPVGGVARARLLGALAPRNISAIYVFVLLFVIFAVWVPETFLTSGVWRSLLATQALNALVAIAVVIPLAAGVFNLAVGAEVGLAGV